MNIGAGDYQAEIFFFFTAHDGHNLLFTVSSTVLLSGTTHTLPLASGLLSSLTTKEFLFGAPDDSCEEAEAALVPTTGGGSQRLLLETAFVAVSAHLRHKATFSFGLGILYNIYKAISKRGKKWTIPEKSASRTT